MKLAKIDSACNTYQVVVCQSNHLCLCCIDQSDIWVLLCDGFYELFGIVMMWRGIKYCGFHVTHYSR